MSSKKISFDLNQVRQKFFGCVNSILNHSGGMSDMVKLRLAESYCYPLLSYALERFNFHKFTYATIECLLELGLPENIPL